MVVAMAEVMVTAVGKGMAAGKLGGGKGGGRAGGGGENGKTGGMGNRRGGGGGGGGVLGGRGVATADTEDELLAEAGRHAEEVHGMEVTPELVEQVRAKIQLVPETGAQRI